MKKKIKGRAKAKGSIGKRTVKAKTTATRRVGASAASFELNVPASLGKKLTAVAESDKSFKGSNAQRYAMFLIKNAVSHPVADKPLADKT